MLAYLLSAYRDPQHLARLIRALDDGEADFFVHIDLSVDDRPFREAVGSGVTFVPRHRVRWGGWEQVEYQRELLKAALRRTESEGRSYTHLVCLSGQDYPLWSNSRLRDFFKAREGRQLICGYDLTHGTSEAQQRKFTRIHPFRDLPWQSRWLRDKAVVLSRHALALLGFRRRPTVEIGGRLCPVFFGSDYWALTPDCARYVVDTLEREPAVSHYFRTTFVPSELCIQTLVFNHPVFAPAALLTTGDYPGLTALTPLTYINYGAQIKVLTLADLATLKASDKPFCRKVVTGVSDALADAIDAERSEDAPAPSAHGTANHR